MVARSHALESTDGDGKENLPLRYEFSGPAARTVFDVLRWK
jgi:hypothetical protein